jgi:rRNA processing protein Gar1
LIRRRNVKHERHSDRFPEIEDQYAGYEVYDHNGEKIGKVDDLFVDDNDRPEYIGVKTGFPGAGSPLIPCGPYGWTRGGAW